MSADGSAGHSGQPRGSAGIPEPGRPRAQEYWCHQCEREITPMLAPGPVCPRCHGCFVEEIETENDPRDFQGGLGNDAADEDEMENEFGGAGNYNQELQTMLQDLLTHIVGRQMTGEPFPPEPAAGQEQGPRSSYREHNAQGALPTQNAARGQGALGAEGARTAGDTDAFATFSRATDRRAEPLAAEGASQGGRRLSGTRTWSSNVNGTQVSVSMSDLPSGGLGAMFSSRQQRPADGGGANDEDPQDNEHTRQAMFIDPVENAPISLGNLVSSLLGVLGGAQRGDGPAQIFGVPMGNFGDYVWGQNSFDDIITQIMEQNQGAHAPPPASDEAILKLPKRQILAAEADGKLECGICMDEYSAGDMVLTLPCKHLYHEECIDHWLKMNGTCPICRTRIDDKPNDAHGAGAPPPQPHSDLPGSFPTSPPPAPPSSREARGQGAGVAHHASTSASPPAPEPMD